ncbi:MAG: hypothetical protein JRG94_25270, partial [Deltaproteobacteria bacterium]|nr:hypothetical protein [Deltaproteobacteria bacterium]
MLRVLRALLADHPAAPDFLWITCAGEMGEDALRAAGFEKIEVVYRPAGVPEASDTRAAAEVFVEVGATLVVF